MSDQTKDFCLVRKNLIKNIPQKTWIRYIAKKNMVINKGGMLLKNNVEDKKESYLLLKSPYGPMWRVKPDENYIYVDKIIVQHMKDKKNTKEIKPNKNTKKVKPNKNTKKIKIGLKKKYNKKTKIIKLDI